jgi:hypothetical protein
MNRIKSDLADSSSTLIGSLIDQLRINQVKETTVAMHNRSVHTLLNASFLDVFLRQLFN